MFFPRLLTVRSGYLYLRSRFRGYTVRLYSIPRYSRLQEWGGYRSSNLSVPLHSLPGRFLLFRRSWCDPYLECNGGEDKYNLTRCLSLEMCPSHYLPVVDLGAAERHVHDACLHHMGNEHGDEQ